MDIFHKNQKNMITGITIYRIVLILGILLCYGCKDSGSVSSHQDNSALPEKLFSVDENGNILTTEMTAGDFEDSENCQPCHSQHYQEWAESIHAKSMQDPLFFSGWNGEQNHRPETGERFCVQCHNPIAYVTGTDLSGFTTAEEFQNSDLPIPIKEGIGCDICHSYTGLSGTVFTGDDVAANADYHFYPGENIKYGSMENPISTENHLSEFAAIYSKSEICLPCHDFVIRGVEAEVTYTEWSRLPAFAMSGAGSCQDCHMRRQSNGHTDHRFVGVDMDLSIAPEDNPQYTAIQELLQETLTVEFGFAEELLPEEINAGNTLNIPVTVTSLTAHAVPSGVSFAREVWMEALVTDADGDVLFSSGVIENPQQQLNIEDPYLLRFTSFIQDADGNQIGGITDAHGLINQTLAALSQRFHNYEFVLPAESEGMIDISLRMLFRPFSPATFSGQHENLLENLPVFEMAAAAATVEILP